MFEDEDHRPYRVVRNQAGQFSLWPEDRSPPPGWKSVGVSGSREECLLHIEQVWVDLQPKGTSEASPPTSGE